MSIDLSMFDLSGKKALVTGGNTGIGLGMAQGLAQAGAVVGITGRNESKNKSALEQLRKSCPAARAFVMDMNDSAALPELYTSASEAMGGINILVNNAGMQCRGKAEEIALEDFEQIVRVNLTAPYVLSQCFARERIAARQDGCVIMTASLMSEAARPTTSAYTATKGGIRQLVRALAVDWAPHNIRVNGIGPGYIETGMTKPLVENDEFSAWVEKRTPLGRWGKPQDFAGAAVYLCSDAAAFVTGQILYVDGGWLATF